MPQQFNKPLFSNGNGSCSEFRRKGQNPVIVGLGDHDSAPYTQSYPQQLWAEADTCLFSFSCWDNLTLSVNVADTSGDVSLRNLLMFSAVELRLVSNRSHRMQYHSWSRLRTADHSRRGGRVVDCSGLENRRTARFRGFESLPLRQFSVSGGAFRTSRTEIKINVRACSSVG